MDPNSLLLAAFAMFLGGVLKGAIGAGSPVVAIPILSVLYGVPFAVALFVLPNLFSNIWQGWQFRQQMWSWKFALLFAGAGTIGAGLGTFLLIALSGQSLMRLVAFMVLLYVVFRLARPGWRLSHTWAFRLVVPVGFIGGILQGSGGISAPISVTFLNALKMERGAFIATISIFFLTMALIQIPTLMGLGILTPQGLGFSFAAFIPLLAGMGVGQYLVRHVPAHVFDKLLLGLMILVAVKLILFPGV